MVRKPKMNQVMSAIGLLMIGAIAALFTVWLALLPARGGTISSPLLGVYEFNTLTLKSSICNILLWLFMPLPAVFAFEGGLWRFTQGVKMRKQALCYKPKTIWSRLGEFESLGAILYTAIFMLLFILLLALALHELWYSPKVFSYRILIYFSATAGYLLLRKKLSAALKAVVEKFKKGMPTYTLTEDGVIIKLVTMMNKKYPDPPTVYIGFNEIDDLQIFTLAEAEAFLKYNIGPDFQLGIRQTQDYAAYIKGSISRPSVYAFGGAQENCVLIRGHELFYLITFENDDVSDLVHAYQTFKSSQTSLHYYWRIHNSHQK